MPPHGGGRDDGSAADERSAPNQGVLATWAREFEMLAVEASVAQLRCRGMTELDMIHHLSAELAKERSRARRAEAHVLDPPDEGDDGTGQMMDSWALGQYADTTGDGRIDSHLHLQAQAVAMDTTGDGRTDTIATHARMERHDIEEKEQQSLGRQQSLRKRFSRLRGDSGDSQSGSFDGFLTTLQRMPTIPRHMPHVHVHMPHMPHMHMPHIHGPVHMLGARHRRLSAQANDRFTVKELEKKLKIKVQKSKLNHDSNVKHAACYMTDAFHGRLKNGLGSVYHQPWYIATAFKIHSSNFHKKSLKYTSILLLFVILYEPHNFYKAYYLSDYCCGHSATQVLYVRLVELVILLYLFSDYLLRLTYMGWKKIKQKYFIRLLMLFEIVLILDCVVALCVGPRSLRVSRFMRPYVYTLLDKPTLQLTRQCIKAAASLRTLFAMLAVFVFFFSIMASSVMSEELWRRADVDWDFQWRPFDSFENSIIPLLSLITIEAYPEIIKPITAQAIELSCIFYALIIIAAYTILNFAVASQVEGFKNSAKDTTSTEEKKLIKTFGAVYYLARDEMTKKVSLGSFTKLVMIHKPRIKADFVEEMFIAIHNGHYDHDDPNDGLGLDEFLKLAQVLRSSEVSDPDHYEHNWFFSKFYEYREWVRKQATRQEGAKAGLLDQRLRMVMTSQRTRFFFLGVNIVNVCMLAAMGETSSQEWATMVITWDFACYGVYVLDMLLQMRCESIPVYTHDNWNRFVVVNVCMSALLFVLEEYSPLVNWYFGDRLLLNHPKRSVHKLCGALRALAIIQYERRLRDVFVIVVQTFPVIKEFMVVIFVFIYQNTMISLELLYQTESFKDPMTALNTQLTMLQFDGWQNHCYTLMSETNSWTQGAAILLVLVFILTCQIIFLSQLMANMYAVYRKHETALLLKEKKAAKGNLKDKGAKGGKEKKADKEDKQSDKGDQSKKTDKADKAKGEDVSKGSKGDRPAKSDKPSKVVGDTAGENFKSNLKTKFGKAKSKHWRSGVYEVEEDITNAISKDFMQSRRRGSLVGDAHAAKKAVAAERASKAAEKPSKVEPAPAAPGRATATKGRSPKPLSRRKSQEDIAKVKKRFQMASQKSSHWRRDLHSDSTGDISAKIASELAE